MNQIKNQIKYNKNQILLIILIFLLIILILEFFNKKRNKNFPSKGKKKFKKNNSKQNAGFQNKKLLNIYNEPLKKCGTPSMSNGSWDSQGYCSELDGGVHQICIKEISKNAKNFSLTTQQSNWSDKRGKDNHCVCLGAWSLYNAKNNKKKSKSNLKSNAKRKINKKSLKCDAIPKNSLSDNYVSKFSEGWNKWNGYELDNQIVDGINALMKNCYQPDLKPKKSKNLKTNYCNFSKNHNNLKNSNYYKKICK